MWYFITELKTRNEMLFWYGLACVAFALVFLALAQTTNHQLGGANVWYKPFKFFISTAIFVATMGWLLAYLDKPTLVLFYSGFLVLAFSFLIGYIAIQAARGEHSHFNQTTPFHATMFSLMALFSVGIALFTGFVAIFFFSSTFPDLPPSYVWGIRLGLVLFVLFALEGLVMGSRLSHHAGQVANDVGLPVLNWSRKVGDLRIAHFLGMHAIQVLPLVGYHLVQDARAIAVLAVFYFLFTTFTLLQALQGKPFIP